MKSFDFKSFIECDTSPFILFNSSGNILYTNKSAEVLLGYVDKKVIFELALNNAPKNYGCKVTILFLQYGIFEFYAINVGYYNDEEIFVRFYNRPKILSAEYSQNSSKLIPTNINNLLELAITIFKSKFDIEVSLLVDYDIPEFKIDQNSFSKIIRKVLDSFKENGKIDISLKFLLGEHIVIEGKRYQLLELRVKGDSLRDKSDDLEIEIVAAKMNISTHFRDDEITLQIPFIN